MKNPIGSERAYADEVANWCARELADARKGDLTMGRAYVQNIDLIIKALREYAATPPKVVKECWVNIYADENNRPAGLICHPTRAAADLAAYPNRFACIRIPEVTEGEGL
jgi:hypothetical protein